MMQEDGLYFNTRQLITAHLLNYGISNKTIMDSKWVKYPQDDERPYLAGIETPTGALWLVIIDWSTEEAMYKREGYESVIGYIHGAPWTSMSLGHFHLDWVEVFEPYQRQGKGKEAIKLFGEMVDERGFLEIWHTSIVADYFVKLGHIVVKDLGDGAATMKKVLR